MHFMLLPQVENKNLPTYNKFLGQLDQDYLVLTNTLSNYTDIIFFESQGFRHIIRYPKVYHSFYQH